MAELHSARPLTTVRVQPLGGLVGKDAPPPRQTCCSHKPQTTDRGASLAQSCRHSGNERENKVVVQVPATRGRTIPPRAYVPTTILWSYDPIANASRASPPLHVWLCSWCWWQRRRGLHAGTPATCGTPCGDGAAAGEATDAVHGGWPGWLWLGGAPLASQAKNPAQNSIFCSPFFSVPQCGV